MLLSNWRWQLRAVVFAVAALVAGSAAQESDCELLSQLLPSVAVSKDCCSQLPDNIGCLQNRIISLNFAHTNLNGTISPLIGKLSMLENINLSNNQLSGWIPPEIGNLAYLSSLNLTNNHLRGVLPERLGNLLHNNQLSALFFSTETDTNQFQLPVPSWFQNMTEKLGSNFQLRLTKSDSTPKTSDPTYPAPTLSPSTATAIPSSTVAAHTITAYNLKAISRPAGPTPSPSSSSSPSSPATSPSTSPSSSMPPCQSTATATDQNDSSSCKIPLPGDQSTASTEADDTDGNTRLPSSALYIVPVVIGTTLISVYIIVLYRHAMRSRVSEDPQAGLSSFDEMSSHA